MLPEDKCTREWHPLTYLQGPIQTIFRWHLEEGRLFFQIPTQSLSHGNYLKLLYPIYLGVNIENEINLCMIIKNYQSFKKIYHNPWTEFTRAVFSINKCVWYFLTFDIFWLHQYFQQNFISRCVKLHVLYYISFYNKKSGHGIRYIV